jgi:hypothetical protein
MTLTLTTGFLIQAVESFHFRNQRTVRKADYRRDLGEHWYTNKHSGNGSIERLDSLKLLNA